jgi:hypothetical protein
VAFHDVRVDRGEKGQSVGDERIYADSLLDAQGRKVGHDAVVCMFRTLTPPEAVCQITFLLPHGESQRSSSTPRRLARSRRSSAAPAPRKVAAIVGGTGAYRGAHRNAVIVEGPRQTGTITFRLTG